MVTRVLWLQLQNVEAYLEDRLCEGAVVCVWHESKHKTH